MDQDSLKGICFRVELCIFVVVVAAAACLFLLLFCHRDTVYINEIASESWALFKSVRLSQN